ncbi:SET domain-containing protein [Xylariaceae sp. AK1471]|nr:SET domain-containing protein [Xylariaceae sp. AK1471]
MQSLATLSPPRDYYSEASFGAPADTFSNVASLSSTPPTTVADDASLASDTPKNDGALPIGTVDEVAESMTVNESSEAADSIVITTTTRTTTAEIFTTSAETTESPKITRPKTAESTSSTPASERSRRPRLSAPIYNLAKLAGTAIHGKRRSKGDQVADRKRRTTSATTLVETPEGSMSPESVMKTATTPVKDTIHASDSRSSARDTKSPKSKASKKQEDASPKRIATRRSGLEAETLATKLSNLGKRGRKTFEKGVAKMSRELKRLQDTNEYSGIDTKPVLYTYWANGKYVDPSAPEEPPTKKVKMQDDSAYDVPEMEEEEAAVVEDPTPKKRHLKKWMDRGLYAGQEAPTDIFKGLTANEKKKLAQLPELAPSAKINKTLPAPIFLGLRTLIEGRDFKLPFDVCNPLPPGQPKPDEWRKMTRNRFVGDAAAYWKKTPHFKDYQSKCVCTPEDGCGETCQNRIMLYECDSTNCNVGEHLCQNRAFARLQERTKVGGKFRVGVEVIKTSDRGYGIRANRCFQANQIIMEYTGEIITEEECDRRMNEKYQDNQCYYLMSFDQNMIIDATTGSIARFVNHSCQPNCRMVKWIVSGQPRMALFAGDRDITTGDELTYDYNFDPFSAKNVQKCLCGSPNCRGVLGPKPKEVKPPKPSKEELAKLAKESAKGGKRKLKEAFGEPDDAEASTAKKLKIKTASGVKAVATGVKRTTSLKAATKGAATVIKRSMSTISVNTKAALGKKNKTPTKKISKVTKSKSVIRSYGKPKSPANKITKSQRATPKKTASRKSNLSIVAAGAENEMPGNNGPSKTTTPSRAGSGRNSIGASPLPRKALDLPRIRLVNSPRNV